MNPIKAFFGKILAILLRPSGPFARLSILVALAAVLYLDAQGMLNPLKDVLDSPKVTLRIQNFAISPYRVLQTVLVFIALAWIASLLSDWLGQALRHLKKLQSSDRTLITQVSRIAIYIILFLVGLNILGLDLTTLTIFSGAVGIGIGFGLQKIASNFISGMILLFEKTVEEDDLIELDDGTAGYIRKVGGRFAILETFDGKEIMIPNEDFITSRVVNWTYSDLKGRIEIWVGVAYGSDYELARKCILEAALEHPSCIREPEPQAHLRRFNDSSVDFVLYFWVEDIRTGRLRPQSEVMMEIAKKFDENGITIPFPQRDVHVKNESQVP